jgi:predicted transcriptional regulator
VEVTVVRSVDEARHAAPLRPGDAHALPLGAAAHAQRTFQLAHQIGLLEAGRRARPHLTDDPALSSPEARALARVALANYVAGRC